MASPRLCLIRCRMLLLLLAASVAAWPAVAQAPYCVTARSQCPVRGMPPLGTHCACPDHPGVWGMVDMVESAQPYDPVLQHRAGREELRNDDLDDGDDVLAGPRWHRHRREMDDDYP